MTLIPPTESLRLVEALTRLIEHPAPPPHANWMHGRKGGVKLFHEIENHGGFTYRPISNDTPKSGFSLSIFPEREKVVSQKDLNPKVVREYLHDNEDILKQKGAYAGGWNDKEAGKVYLDISIVEPNRQKAIALARKHNQEGIYDLGKGETIITKEPEKRRLAASARGGEFPLYQGTTSPQPYGRRNQGIREGFRWSIRRAFDLTEFNPHHDKAGRFAKTSGSGSGIPNKELYPNTEFVGFDEMDPKVRKEVVSAFNELGAKYPETAKSLNAIEMGGSEPNDYSTAATYYGSPFGNGISLNPNLFSNKEKLDEYHKKANEIDEGMKGNYKKWNSDTSTTRNVIVHEYGHALNKKADDNVAERRLKGDMRKDDPYQGFYEAEMKPADEPSLYARTNTMEHFAETFVQIHNGKKPKNPSADVVRRAIREAEGKDIAEAEFLEFNPHHDKSGKFAKTGASGAGHIAKYADEVNPDTTKGGAIWVTSDGKSWKDNKEGLGHDGLAYLAIKDDPSYKDYGKFGVEWIKQYTEQGNMRIKADSRDIYLDMPSLEKMTPELARTARKYMKNWEDMGATVTWEENVSIQRNRDHKFGHDLKSFNQAFNQIKESDPLILVEKAIHRLRREVDIEGPRAKLRDEMSDVFDEQHRLIMQGLTFSEAKGSAWERRLSGAQSRTKDKMAEAIQTGAETGLNAGGLTLTRVLFNDPGAEMPPALPAEEYLKNYGFDQADRIDSHTQNLMRSVLSAAAKGEWTAQETADAITQLFSKMSKDRAETIAKYELGSAYEAGQEFAARSLGVKIEHKWNAIHDGRTSPECLDNSAAGWIPIDEDFPSGHSRPLAHPHCRCSAQYRIAGQRKTLPNPLPLPLFPPLSEADELVEFNPHHDKAGKFAKSSGSGSAVASKEEYSPEVDASLARIDQATTTWELESILSNHFGDKDRIFNLHGLDPEAMKPVAAEMVKMSYTHKPITDHWGGFEAYNSDDSSYAHVGGDRADAFIHDSSGEARPLVYLNRKYFGDAKAFKEVLKKDEESGWHPKDSAKPEFVAVHEMGHVASHRTTNPDDDVYTNNVRDFEQWFGYSKRPSEYAKKNETENFAERFADYYFKSKQNKYRDLSLSDSAFAMSQYVKNKKLATQPVTESLADFEEFNPHHDKAGRFAKSSGKGGGKVDFVSTPTVPRLATVKLTKVDGPMFTGEKITVNSKITSTQTGRIGEASTIAWLKDNGHPDAHYTNIENPSYPVDVAYDHKLVEVKSSIASSGNKDWRIGINRFTSKEEEAWYKNVATPAERTKHNNQKTAYAVQRKLKALTKASDKLGVQIKGETIGTIVHPDKSHVELYKVPGFHPVIGWKDKKYKPQYLGTYKYQVQPAKGGGKP